MSHRGNANNTRPTIRAAVWADGTSKQQERNKQTEMTLGRLSACKGEGTVRRVQPPLTDCSRKMATRSSSSSSLLTADARLELLYPQLLNEQKTSFGRRKVAGRYGNHFSNPNTRTRCSCSRHGWVMGHGCMTDQTESKSRFCQDVRSLTLNPRITVHYTTTQYLYTADVLAARAYLQGLRSCASDSDRADSK